MSGKRTPTSVGNNSVRICSDFWWGFAMNPHGIIADTGAPKAFMMSNMLGEMAAMDEL
jgi:hypothetical protein